MLKILLKEGGLPMNEFGELYKPDSIIPETTGRHPSDMIITNPLVQAFARLSEKQLTEMIQIVKESSLDHKRTSQKEEGYHTDGQAD